MSAVRCWRVEFAKNSPELTYNAADEMELHTNIIDLQLVKSMLDQGELTWGGVIPAERI